MPELVQTPKTDSVAEILARPSVSIIELLSNRRVQVCAPEMLEETALPELEDGDECLTR